MDYSEASKENLERLTEFYVRDEKGEFSNAARVLGYDAEEVWKLFDSVDTPQDDFSRRLVRSQDLDYESAAEYLDMSETEALLTWAEEGKPEEREYHSDEDVINVLEQYLQNWKDPREIKKTVETGEVGVKNILNRAGIDTVERVKETSLQRLRLAERKGLEGEELKDFVGNLPKKDWPLRYLDKEELEKTTQRYENNETVTDVDKHDAAAWLKYDQGIDTAPEMATNLLRMGYDVERGEEDELLEQTDEEPGEGVKEFLEDKHGRLV